MFFIHFHSHLDDSFEHEKLGNLFPSKIDIRSKILITLAISFLATFLITYEELFFLSLLILINILLFRARFEGILKKLVVAFPLLFSIAILIFLSNPDNGFLSLGNTIIIYTRVELSIFYLLKGFIIVIAILSLIESENNFFAVIYGLSDLGLPSILVNILLFTYRSYIDLQQEAIRMNNARIIRQAGKKIGRLKTYKLIGFMIGGVILRSFIRNHQRKDALIARGFTGQVIHQNHPWMFAGLSLLWINLIILISLFFIVRVKFLPFGIVV
ncbi:MAG: energy-coupling factor transporter transmembrane component T family protein [Candidatus Thorarchaeota archaeon]